MGLTLITGGNAGLGLEASRRLVNKGEGLVLAGRDHGRLESTASDLRSSSGMHVETLHLDLGSLESVRAAAAEVRRLIAEKKIPRLDALLCNAGAQFQGPISYSKDGYEETFAGNYLGHFLLVNLLLDCMMPNGRIVFTASGTHDPATMDGKMVGKAVEPNAVELANQGKRGKPISGGKRYTTSKLCTVLFSYELNRRLKSHHSDIKSIAFDPGLIPETGLTRTAPPVMAKFLQTGLAKWLFRMMGVTMGSLSFSGDALARIATDPQFKDAAGQYLQSNNGSLNRARSSRTSYDVQQAGKLWKDSETLVGLEEREKAEVLR